jgi:hypothetical protein
MKSTIDQLVLNLDTLQFTLYISYCNGQKRIPIDHADGKIMVSEFKNTYGVLLDTIVDKVNNCVYYVPFRREG